MACNVHLAPSKDTTVPPSEVVITGVGIVSPIGIEKQSFWDALCAGRSGVGPIRSFDASGLPIRIAAEVDDFNPKLYVKQRRSLKVMARDAQFGIAATELACRDSGIAPGVVDPDRFGVVLGADRICGSIEDSERPYRNCMVDGRFDFSRWATEGMAVSFPLGFLRVLPNMIASHVSIAQDARGPNNTIHHADVSALLALSEAVAVIQRGAADVMIAGGASSAMAPLDCTARCVLGILSPRQDDPAASMRPFDADRDGQVWGEGGAAFILESRRHAEARGANISARVLGWASAWDPHCKSDASDGMDLRRAIRLALEKAELTANQVGHVNAQGLSTIQDDRLEARAIHSELPAVPVTAPKSYFGNLGAASGAMEMAVSVLALQKGLVPAVLNYERPDPDCPVQVIHGQPMASSAPVAVLVNRTSIGQAAALVLAGPN